MFRIIVGQNVKKYRLEKGWTQQKLAEEVGYTDRSSIARIEKGSMAMPDEKIAIIAETLNVTIDQLTGRSEKGFSQMAGLGWFFKAIEKYAVDLNRDGLNQIIARAAEVHDVPKYRINQDE